jgi:predicted AlkP superfamily phosphohydrolase/phosphomutase
MIFGRRKKRKRDRGRKRIVGIGLDGFPFSLAARLIDEGVMPHLHRMAERGTFKRIKSVYPTVSGVAWSAFQTGKNPGEFGVYGFVDLTRDFDLTIPNAGDLKSPTMWQRLDEAGKQFAALGVPMTYPAPKVNGFMVSGFLAPQLDERACSSAGVLSQLEGMKYEIDIDPGVAIQDPVRFKEDLKRVAEARRDAALSLLNQDIQWDLFFVHVMDTDRLHHFMWNAVTDPGSKDAGYFYDFYKKTDDFLGQVIRSMGEDDQLFVCSDHGFCELKWEVQLNRWLKSEGYLDFENAPEKGYKALRPGSRAVSLVPGRIYILTESKWDGGGVTDAGYDPLRKELMAKLRDLRHPDTGEAVCKEVMGKEDVFEGPYTDSAPDIVCDPCNGFDLKARLGEGDVFEKGPRTGMHTYDDAMLLAGRSLRGVADSNNIVEVGRNVASYIL